MGEVIHLVLYALLLLICLAAVALNLLSLPGNWVMWVLVAMWSGLHAWQQPHWLVLSLMVVVLLMAEAMELLGSMVGARKFGASKTASWAAIAGAMVGALAGTFIPILLIGNLIGAIAGAFLAAWVVELLKKRPVDLATKAALGAALGRGVGIVAKIGGGMIVWACVAWFAFPR